MENSVNWYFQSIDSRLGAGRVQDYLHKISYGNQDSSAGLSSYWLEASLKISPMEQTALLIKLYRNDFGFAPCQYPGGKGCNASVPNSGRQPLR